MLNELRSKIEAFTDLIDGRKSKKNKRNLARRSPTFSRNLKKGTSTIKVLKKLIEEKRTVHQRGGQKKRHTELKGGTQKGMKRLPVHGSLNLSKMNEGDRKSQIMKGEHLCYPQEGR